MAWTIQWIDEWATFQNLAGRIDFVPTPLEVQCVYRGQARSEWDLKPSLARALPNSSRAYAEDIENDLIAGFREEAHLHLPQSLIPTPSEPYDWLPRMQHSGAPTRLLDWTTSIHAMDYELKKDQFWAEFFGGE